MQQVCAAARSEEDKNTGAILKCLVGSVDLVSSSCARETGRAARNALQFYAPKAPVTDVCDSDIAALCLGSQGLNAFGIGEVRACLANQIAVAAPPDIQDPAMASGGSQACPSADRSMPHVLFLTRRTSQRPLATAQPI